DPRKDPPTTAAQWLACRDPMRMLDALGETVSRRKCHLFACACVRQIWHLLNDERSRQAVEVAERVADGRATKAELRHASNAARTALNDYLVALREFNHPCGPSAAYELTKLEDDGAFGGARLITHWTADPLFQVSRSYEDYDDEYCQRQPKRLRDLFGNPFRPVTFNPAWRTPTVTALAQAAYDDRLLPGGTLDTDRLAVLADALDEAGCDNA